MLIDASFRAETTRLLGLKAATRWGVPGLILVCQAGPGIVRDRLQAHRDDASDADWSIYLQAARRWEALGPRTLRTARVVVTDSSSDQALAQALAFLGENDLVSS